MKEEGEDNQTSRVERSLSEGYWYFPLEPTSEEICAALKARNNNHYEDGYPDNLVSLNRFFVMHKVGYRNGKGVKLEGWKTYDDHLMTKTSSGPLNGNENLVLRIFALRPVTKGVEPIKLCWVKELSKGHQSGRRKKFQPEEEQIIPTHKKPKTGTSSSSKSRSSPPSTPPSSFSEPLTPNKPLNLSPTTSNLHYRSDTFPKQEPHSPLPTSKNNTNNSILVNTANTNTNNNTLPGLHVTLAGLAGTLPPLHLPPIGNGVPLPASNCSTPPYDDTYFKTEVENEATVMAQRYRYDPFSATSSSNTSPYLSNTMNINGTMNNTHYHTLPPPPTDNASALYRSPSPPDPASARNGRNNNRKGGHASCDRDVPFAPLGTAWSG